MMLNSISSLLVFHFANAILVKDVQKTRIETCSPLKNHQTFSSVEVAIGNPAQLFNLVADTGSNSCIVKDCACKQCPKSWGNCFTGPEHSKSFNLPLFKVNKSDSPNLKQGDMAPAAIVMSFGSGQIAAQIASDEVRIGMVRTFMDKGLLLMVDHALNLEGPFEGILGLGRPSYKESGKSKNEAETSPFTIPGFFDAAHVQRFSMCFNHQADGVLGVNTPEHSNRLSSVGRLHWGLDFQGVSIGKEKLKVGFCDPSSKKEGMETACGIIPDSGTTLIAGNEANIGVLFEALCQNWKRCQKMHGELVKELKKMAKAGISVSGPGGIPFAMIQKEPEIVAEMVAELLTQTEGAKEESKGFGPGPIPLGDQVPAEFTPAGLQRAAAEDAAEDDQEPAESAPESPGAESKEGSPEGAAADAQAPPDFAPEPRGSPGAESQEGSPEEFKLPQALTLQLLLEHCASWIEGVDLNQEMPELTFNVAGANGQKQELIITPKNYVLARAVDVEVPTVANVMRIPLKTKKLEHKKVCMMAFSPTQYTTQLNGDVWIMGTPLFYEYTAHYDRGAGGEEKDIGMGFTAHKEEDCGTCQGNTIQRPSQSLIGSESTRSGHSTTRSGMGMEALKYLDKQPVIRPIRSSESI
mmetsp:Transcript_44584/g.70923  ORF Transcript_44584/g.70923 Transcript_44584/m.70923 type:complete len:637 (-) Transcript_44584:70-1980(-)